MEHHNLIMDSYNFGGWFPSLLLTTKQTKNKTLCCKISPRNFYFIAFVFNLFLLIVYGQSVLFQCNRMNLSTVEDLLMDGTTGLPNTTTASPAEEDGNSEAYLYDVAEKIFLYVDPVITFGGIIANMLMLAVMLVRKNMIIITLTPCDTFSALCHHWFR